MRLWTNTTSTVRSRAGMPHRAGAVGFPHVGECRQRGLRIGGVVKDDDGGRVSAAGKAM